MIKYMKIDFRQNSYQNKQNFNGTYIVQIPHKVFSNPNNIQECSKLVGNSINKFMMDNKFGQKFYKFLKLFQFKVLCYPEKFSNTFFKKAMEKNGLSYSLQWFKMNTGLPVADVLKEGYHSFFVFTGKDKHIILKQIIKAGGDTDFSELMEKFESDPGLQIASIATQIGVTLDKAIGTLYERAQTFTIESLTELPEVARAIKSADKANKLSFK